MLKLYVWDEVNSGGYSPGGSVAIAHSKKEALKLIEKEGGYIPEHTDDHLTVYPLDEKGAWVFYGGS